MTDLLFLPTHEIARLIRTRQVSACQVVEAYLRQIETHNPRLNAIVTLDAEGALRRAREADEALARGAVWGPLHGVPFTVKDALATAGMRTTSGSPRLARYVPKEDATVVARLRSAGGILLGKTNLPEFCMGNHTDNRVFGRTNNPWALDRTTSGSSGGAAAAIAAGLSALEIGSDIGGSIRRPAGFCGIFGMKPTDNLVPHTGHIPPPPGVSSWGLTRYLFSIGPLARSAADLRLALQIIAGPDGQHTDVPPMALPAPPAPALESLRIAWMDDCGIPLAAEVRAAMEQLASRLAAAGCRVERCAPTGFDFRAALHADGLIEQGGFQAKAALPRPLLRGLSKLVERRDPLAAGYIAGYGATLNTYTDALIQRDLAIQSLERFLTEWDAWIVPVSSTPAFPHPKALSSFEMLRLSLPVDGQQTPYFLATAGHCNPFNLTGSPVVVMPAGRTSDELPIGIQLVGRRFQDAALLAVAERLEEVIGRFQPPPGYQA